MKEKLSILYRFIIVVVTGIGLYLNLQLAEPRILLLYFTIISNIMVFLYFGITLVLELIGKLNKSKYYYIFGGLATLFITLTMSVYEIALSDTAIYQGHMMECNFVHLYTPLLTIFYYLFFTQKGNIKKEYSVIWVIPLIIYAVFIEMYSMLGGRFLDNEKFPYPFMDVDKYGHSYVMTICTLFVVAFIGFGLIVYQLDKYLEEKGKKKHE